MNRTAPRCVQCGENPRIAFEGSEGFHFHPLCEECHLELREASYREAGMRQTIQPKRPMNLLELLVTQTRFMALGAALFSLPQLVVVFLKGPLIAVIIHSVIMAITAPWAAAGFWLRRRNR
jgi:hypothetical protein